MDIRIPLGLIFLIYGLLLAGYGLATRGAAMYAEHSLGINLNLWWGLAMLVFGGVMFALGRRGGSEMRPSSPSAVATASPEPSVPDPFVPDQP